MSLNSEQIAFFKTNGYLLVPGAMDTDLCARGRDLMWSALPEDSSLQRHDAASHTGPFPDAERVTGSLHVRDGYRWLNRALGVTSEVVELIYSETICAMAEQLHGPAWPGGPTDPALGTEGARGVYCTLPYGDRPREPDACHTDGHPFQLGVVGLLDDIPEEGGAFKVWPGSHQRLYQTFKLRYDQPRIPYYDHLPALKGILHTDEYLSGIEELNQAPSVECWGKAGDIVFWHHRMAHMAGHNHSNVIRQAVLADFWRPELDEYRTWPVSEDMWKEWSGAVQNSDGRYSEAFARNQRLPGA